MRSLIFAVNPIAKFELATGVSPILSAPFNLGVGNNQTVIAAITGKRIRVMGWDNISQGAVGTMNLKDGNAGTILFNFPSPPFANGIPYYKAITDSGYGETTAGTGLFADVVTAGVYGTVFYIA